MVILKLDLNFFKSMYSRIGADVLYHTEIIGALVKLFKMYIKYLLAKYVILDTYIN